MPYILSLLPVLACPVGMGLIMWLMMRGHKEQPTRQDNRSPMKGADNVDTVREWFPPAKDTGSVYSGNEPSSRSSMLSMLFMCLNWKVVGGLAVIAVIIGIIAPNLLLGAIPLLIVAVCPLSMLFMMRGMRRGQSQQVQQPSSYPEQENPSFLEGLSDEEQIAALKVQLAHTEAQQQALTRQIAELELPEAAARPETETVFPGNQR